MIKQLEDILSKKGNKFETFRDAETRLGYLTQEGDLNEYSNFSSFNEEIALRNAKERANQLDKYFNR